MKTVECTYCGEEFERINSKVVRAKNHFCNMECRKKYYDKPLKEKKTSTAVTIACTVCGKEKVIKRSRFDQSATGFFYCSKECQHKHRKGDVLWNNKGGGIEVECKQCGITFRKDRNKVAKRDKKHFCSMKCLDEYKREQSKDTDIRKRIRGLKKYKEWRYAVLERDNYECQECGSNEHLDAHHLIDFWTLIQENNITTVEEAVTCDDLWNLDNGQTLCVYHHAEKHPRNKNLILKRVA